MAETAGVQIRNKFYPFATKFRLGDPVLVEELTGLDWSDFIDRLPDDDTPDDAPGADDPVAMLGLIGVAIWQGNPTWRRDRVVRYVTQLAMEDIEIVGPTVEEGTEEDDSDPDDDGDGHPPEESP